MIKVKVKKISDEALGIRSFLLAEATGKPLPAYEPGAHIDVTGPSGVMRQYSLCGDLGNGSDYLIAVKLEEQSRGGSRSLHDDVVEGSELVISEPRNLFPLDIGADEYVLLGAGIGITPLLAMAQRLQALGKKFRLHYFARSPQHAAFYDTLAQGSLRDAVSFHMGAAPQDMPTLLAQCLDPSPQALVYTCGPAVFMEAVVQCATRTRAKDRVHLEHFQGVDTSGMASQAFDVVLKKSGKTVKVPADVSLSDALTKAGCTVRTSCKEGICGTCIVSVVEGTPDHRDNCLTDDEKQDGDLICACVSRSRSPCLVLDL